MFYAYIPLFSYMDTNMGQMPAALWLRLEITAADRGTVQTSICFPPTNPNRDFVLFYAKRRIRLQSNGFLFFYFAILVLNFLLVYLRVV